MRVRACVCMRRVCVNKVFGCVCLDNSCVCVCLPTSNAESACEYDGTPVSLQSTLSVRT